MDDLNPNQRSYSNSKGAFMSAQGFERKLAENKDRRARISLQNQVNKGNFNPIPTTMMNQMENIKI